jgi:hypothetical protein
MILRQFDGQIKQPGEQLPSALSVEQSGQTKAKQQQCGGSRFGYYFGLPGCGENKLGAIQSACIPEPQVVYLQFPLAAGVFAVEDI